MKKSFSSIEIQQAEEKAKQNSFVNNLRDRTALIGFDCKVRGYLAEIYVQRLLKNNFIEYETNVMGNRDFEDHDIVISENKSIISIKSSLIPDRYDLNKCDLKVYKNTENIDNDINWDIGVQIYFDQKKTTWEKNVENERVNYQQLAIKNFYWILRSDALKNNKELSRRTWNIYKKFFWCCPINKCMEGEESFIKHILEISQKNDHQNNLFFLNKKI